MPNLTLIVGGPGSGKTSEVVSRLAARYEADPFAETVVLVPTVRHGDQLRRRLVVRCGAALRLRVEIIPQFSHQLAMGARAPSRMLAGELLARTARREVERGPAAYFRPIAGTVGFSDLLNAAVDDLLAEAVDPRAFSESAAWTGSPRLTALGAIYAAYHAELERRDWRHPAQIALAAADALRDGAAAPPVVMLDGFHLFRGSELALLQALADRSEVVITLDPDSGDRARHDFQRLVRTFPDAETIDLSAPPPPREGEQFPLFPTSETPSRVTVIAGEAADREAQMRAIARQIKQRLTDEPSLRPPTAPSPSGRRRPISAWPARSLRSTTSRSIRPSGSASATGPSGPGSAGCFGSRRTAGVSETSPSSSPAASSTSTGGGCPAASWPSSPDGGGSHCSGRAGTDWGTSSRPSARMPIQTRPRSVSARRSTGRPTGWPRFSKS